MANFMARYRGGDGHYADVECAYAEFKRRLVLNALRVGNHTQRSAFKVWLRGLTRAPQPLSPHVSRSRLPLNF
jgi:hypothetical protein